MSPVTTAAIDGVLEDLLVRRVAEDASGAPVDIGAFAVSFRCAAVLEAVAGAAPAGDSIEIGCASGAATLAICKGRMRLGDGGGAHHAMDPMQTSHYAGMGHRSIERAGLGAKARIIEKKSAEALPELKRLGVRAGFVFIDGSHHFDAVMLDLSLVDLLLPPGGVVALHDTWMPAVQHAAGFWMTNMPYEGVTVRSGELVGEPWAEPADGAACGDGTPHGFRDRVAPFADHQTVVLRKTAEPRRVWDHFVPFV